MIDARTTSRRSLGKVPFTVAWVPTGMKTGVGTFPLGRDNKHARGLTLDDELDWIENLLTFGNAPHDSYPN